jgi:predicted anti-sigma-YlaC factor YlaD
MIDFPDAVKQVSDDYLERVRSLLSGVPAHEREEFLREIHSHIYEAYQQEPVTDEMARILRVLRKLGEPAELVAGKLPETIARSGRRRRMPLYVFGGIFLAMAAIPLGFGGIAIFALAVAALAAFVVFYHAATAALLLMSAGFMAMAVVRMFISVSWEQMVNLGLLELDVSVYRYLDGMPISEQGMIMTAIAALLAVIGIGMLRMGARLRRGARFLMTLGFDRFRRSAEWARRTVWPLAGWARPVQGLSRV